MGLKSILDHIKSNDLEYVKQRQQLKIDKSKWELEESVARAYDGFKDNLKVIHSDNVFAMHNDVDDIEPGILKEYERLVAKFQNTNYKIKKNSLTRRTLNKTSGWYHSDWAYRSDDDRLAHGAFSFTTWAIPAVTTALVLSNPIGLLAAVPAIGLWYGVFKHKTELKADKVKFNSEPFTVVKDAYRLNYLSQVMEKEVADLENLDEHQRQRLLDNFGGDEGVLRRIETAIKEVKQVKDYTASVLIAAGLNQEQMPKVNKDYVPNAVRKGETLKEIIGESTNKQIEELRRKQAVTNKQKII